MNNQAKFPDGCWAFKIKLLITAVSIISQLSSGSTPSGTKNRGPLTLTSFWLFAIIFFEYFYVHFQTTSCDIINIQIIPYTYKKNTNLLKTRRSSTDKADDYHTRSFN